MAVNTVAVPSDTPVTLPELLTFTISGLDVIQVIDRSVLFSGSTIAAKLAVLPILKFNLDLFNPSLLTGMNSLLNNLDSIQLPEYS
jgi:hypothetical protein